MQTAWHSVWLLMQPNFCLHNAIQPEKVYMSSLDKYSKNAFMFMQCTLHSYRCHCHQYVMSNDMWAFQVQFANVEAAGKQLRITSKNSITSFNSKSRVRKSLINYRLILVFTVYDSYLQGMNEYFKFACHWKVNF